MGTRTNDGQFMWAWGHPSVPGKSRKAAEKVQIFGNKHNLIKLIDRQLDCPGPMPTIAKLPRRLPGKSISGSFDIEIARVAFLVFVFGTSNLP